jgi:hypothetical protein
MAEELCIRCRREPATLVYLDEPLGDQCWLEQCRRDEMREVLVARTQDKFNADPVLYGIPMLRSRT